MCDVLLQTLILALILLILFQFYYVNISQQLKSTLASN